MITRVTTPSVPPAATTIASGEELPEDRYLNRELSWLDFNARVLALAADESLPILERAKFLAIFASNLDEFYMVRVAGLKRRDETGLSVRSADGLSPREQLKLIGERTQEISVQHARVFSESVRPELAENGIFVVTWADLSENERSYLSSYFTDQVFPVLTPLAVDPAHPFPYISGLSLNLAITVQVPETGGQHFARIKVPDNVDRFVRLRSPEGAEAAQAAHTARFLPWKNSSPRICRRCSRGWKSWSTMHSASHGTPISRSRKTGTKIFCRHWNVNWLVAGSAHRFGSRSPTI